MFNSEGYLPPGLHDWDMSQVETTLVDSFPASTTRTHILQGYTNFRNRIVEAGLHGEQWLDGSFCTAKMDPNDLDVVTILDKEDLDNLPEDLKIDLRAYFLGPKTKLLCRCDSYLVVKVPPDHPDFTEYQRRREYWIRRFGHDRNERPKGIIRLTF